MHDLCFMYDMMSYMMSYMISCHIYVIYIMSYMMSYITLLLGSLSPGSALYYKDFRRRKVRKAFTIHNACHAWPHMCEATYL